QRSPTPSVTTRLTSSERASSARRPATLTTCARARTATADAKGIFRHVQYVADAGGFRAAIDTNEPGTAQGQTAGALYNAAPLQAAPVAAPAPVVAAAPYKAAAPYAAYAVKPAPAPAALYAPAQPKYAAPAPAFAPTRAVAYGPKYL
ncbi:adult-specific rigid cuticular protein 15.7, partial [Rhipicephalus sanguineus]|uniref:adult-specific rigid cuticular protein 15.7 n=1 Tax=Rhipicephalus sanguineus TaxID=34632 RepID=UPI001895C35E